MTKVKLSQVIRRCQTRVDRYDTDLLYCVAGEHFESGEIDLAGRGEIAGSTIGPMFYYGFKPGDFLLVSRNPHLKKASRVDFAGICSEKTFVLETADENVLSSEYLPWVLQNDRFWDYAQKNRHGSTNFFINWSTLADYEFELPPVEEQKRIAAILWAAQSVRRNYHKLLKACDDIVKSQFVEMFGDPDIPIKRLESIADIQGGITKNKKREALKLRLPYLRVANILPNELDLTEVKTIGVTEQEYETVRLMPDDLLIVEGNGSGTQIGRSAIWNGQIDPCVHQNHLIRVRLKDGALPLYVQTFLSSPEGRRQITTKAVNTSGLHTLSTGKIRSLEIPVPPLALQQEFAAFACQVDKSKFAIQKALDELNATTKKILNQELGLGDV